MEPMALLGGMTEEKAERIAALAASMGIRVRRIRPDEQGETLSSLCGPEQKRTAEQKTHPAGEMMVMAFFDGKRLDAWLEALRLRRLSVPLKAVLTSVNRTWTWQRLFRELQMEAFMMGGKKA